LSSFRRFLRLAGNVDAVDPELYEQLRLSTMKNGEDVHARYYDRRLDQEQAEQCSDYIPDL